MLELRAEPSDGPASRALWDEYMALVGARLPGFEPTEAIFATPEAFTGPGTAWLVGYESGAAVCCGGLRPLDEAGVGVGEIKRMFVTGAARRRGHGRALLAELERLAVAHGCRRVRLFTTEVLVEARALYESAGYRVVGTVPDGERTDLWLEKALPADPVRERPASMERDPMHEPSGAEPDEEPLTEAMGGGGGAAPSEGDVDRDPRPVEEIGDDREREARGGDA
jgi:GNAT superfamily N-acetyltransferase